jgi:hypothetical protein
VLKYRSEQKLHRSGICFTQEPLPLLLFRTKLCLVEGSKACHGPLLSLSQDPCLWGQPHGFVWAAKSRWLASVLVMSPKTGPMQGQKWTRQEEDWGFEHCVSWESCISWTKYHQVSPKHTRQLCPGQAIGGGRGPHPILPGWSCHTAPLKSWS